MSFVLYMIFGMIEIYALFSLMLKTFRFPYVDYLKEISIIAFSITFFSYLIRVYFELFQLADIVTHMILYILFFRYIFKIKYWRAIIISLTYLGYIVIVLSVFYFYISTNILTTEVLEKPNSLAAYVIQITSAGLSFLISYLIYKLDLGFSFIIMPPHDFIIKHKLKSFDLVMIYSVLVAAIIIFVVLYLIFNTKDYISIPLLIISYMVLIYLAYRRDMAL